MSDPISTDLASLRIDRTKGGRGKGPLIALGVAVLAGLLYVLSGPALSALSGSFVRPEVEVTEILAISQTQALVDLTSTGYVVPQLITKVGVKLPGRVSAVHVKQGQQVAKGDLLLELEKADHEAAIRSARAAAAAARARVHAAKAQLAEVALQAKRQRALADKGVVAKAPAEDLEARVASLTESVRASEAEVSASEAQVAAQRVTLDYMQLHAPIAGTVISEPPEVGEVLSYEVGGLGDTSLIEIADFNSMRVETDVPEARLHMVKVGAPCEIVLDAFPDRRFRGETEAIVPEIDRSKATVGVKVRFVDAMDGVLPEMSARVSFLQAELDAEKLNAAPTPVVPSEAVVERAGAKVVFVLEGETVRMRAVELGETMSGGFELVSGPPVGTRLVSSPADDLQDGQRVSEGESP